MSEKMKSVLFVGTTNRYRSPFAAALFRKKLIEDGRMGSYRVGSAGTWTRSQLPSLPCVYDKAEALGLSLLKHDRVEVSEEMLSEYSLIVVMERGHKEALRIEFPDMRERVFLLSEIVDNVDYDILSLVKAREDVEAIIDELYQLLQRGSSKIWGLANKIPEH